MAEKPTKNTERGMNMAKIDIAQIEGYGDMSLEEKLAVLEGYEIPEADYTGYVKKDILDKTLKEKGDLAKQLKAKQTAEEQEAEALRIKQEEQEEYVKNLENKIALTDATSRFLKLGMDTEMAKQSAQAEIEGNRDIVFANIQKMNEAMIKNAQSEWLKSRPQVQAGTNGNSNEDDEFLVGFGD